MSSKKLFPILFACFLYTILQYPAEQVTFAKVAEDVQKPVPAYAKWGQLAVKKAKEKYPNAAVVDYLHVGRNEKNEFTTETFKLWLRENNREFGLFITIEFETKTEKIRNIFYKETTK
ncbi:YqzG/YhdC family protein [Neobacillus sp. LXY-4]|uniref:YqzG/YhdC family protein n=1 Tax=Neobacillus sp. LXY-4 TaxID=3379826 RepID=UPI003EE2710A